MLDCSPDLVVNNDEGVIGMHSASFVRLCVYANSNQVYVVYLVTDHGICGTTGAAAGSLAYKTADGC